MDQAPYSSWLDYVVPSFDTIMDIGFSIAVVDNTFNYPIAGHNIVINLPPNLH